MTTKEAYRFLIADDHPLFRIALQQTLAGLFPGSDIFEAEDISVLQRHLDTHQPPSLILLDLHMPGAQGFSGLIYLSSHYLQIPVIMISAHDSAEVMRRAFDHGAAGFLSKSSQPQVMAEAITSVLEGNIWQPENFNPNGYGSSPEEMTIAAIISSLTPQQFRVANMLAQGLLNKQIAYELNVTEATVKAHLTEIFRKLGVHSRTQAVLAISQLDVKDSAAL